MSDGVEDDPVAKELGNHIRRSLAFAQEGRYVSVGIQGEEAGWDAGGGATQGEIAVFGELGTRSQEPRPAFRMAFEDPGGKIAQVIDNSAALLLRGELTGEQALSRIGAVAQGQVQTSIRELRDPPNKESTILAKGSDNPLINTGRQIQSVTFVIVEKNG